jgi:hypothetical protein
MPQFVVLEHHHEGVHWDFMLESQEVLRTWRLVAAPSFGFPIAATKLPDHRRVYLDYEGEISGARGYVERWDRGQFEWVVDRPDCIEIILRGRRLNGQVYLRLSESGDWTFRLTPVEFDSGNSAVC